MERLRFNSNDPRDLIETLILALDVTRETGKPSVEFQGCVYDNLMTIIGHLPDEALPAAHQALVDAVFKAKLHGYRRTARNIVTRIHRLDRAWQVEALRQSRPVEIEAEVVARVERQHSAAGEAVTLLAERLGGDLERFLALATTAGPHELHAAFKSIHA